MKWCLGVLLGALCSVASWAATGTYEYPFDDAFVATVVGTPQKYRAELPETIPARRASIRIFPDREVPEYFWYEAQLRYAYALQKGPAPLVFLIAGTGGSFDGAKNKNMARAFYQAGFHIVSLSSPTHPNFMVAASGTGVPGHAVHDAEDLYRVMERIWEEELQNKAQVTDFYVTGYSLGGFNTAFVAWLDEQKRVFNFKKALLINPPVKLYNSVSRLDRMIQNIPGGEDNFAQFFNNLMKEFSEIYKRSDSVAFDDDFLYRVFETMKPKDEELAALIGVSFRLSSAALAFTSDVITDYGYVKPRNVHLTRSSDPTIYSRVAHRLGFTDYYHEFFYPYYKAQDPNLTRESLLGQMSLSHIEDYLRSAEKIEVMHNVDDLILEQGEIDFFSRVFGERAKIYPRGGHCGNMDFRDNVAHMVGVFRQ